MYTLYGYISPHFNPGLWDVQAHETAVHALAIMQLGLLATGSADCTVKVWKRTDKGAKGVWTSMPVNCELSFCEQVMARINVYILWISTYSKPIDLMQTLFILGPWERDGLFGHNNSHNAHVCLFHAWVVVLKGL